MIFCNVCLNQALLVNIAWGQLVFCIEVEVLVAFLPLFEEATGCCGASPETASCQSHHQTMGVFVGKLTCAQHLEFTSFFKVWSSRASALKSATFGLLGNL